MKLLLTNVGRRTYLIDFFLHLKKKHKLKLHVSDCDSSAPALFCNYNVKKHITPPVLSNEKAYLNSLVKIVKSNKIKIIIPLSDLDLIILSKKKFFFKKKFGCDIIVSNFWTVDNCYDKKKLNRICKQNDIDYPEIYDNLKKIKKFPIIKKEIRGSGSNNLQIIKNKSLIKKFEKKFVYQKFIHGTEFHLDILNNFTGKFISCCVKQKILMRAGETDKCIIIKNRKLENFSKKISLIFKHIGNMDCDVIVYKNKIFLIDLNPRFGGGYPFTHLAGLNYLDILINIYNSKKYFLKKVSDKIIVSKGISVFKNK